MSTHRILIVEDEVLIADNISRFLTRKGYQITGSAISYAEASSFYQAQKPDLALLDIRLNGTKTGIDFAHYLQQQARPIPFLFLTSQSDHRNIEAAKKTFPAGYLAKPIQKESLFASVEIALHRYQTERPKPMQIALCDGNQHYRIHARDILFLEADHVYVRVHLRQGNVILQRSSLSDLLKLLPASQFIRTHRSYAVNTRAVSHWDNDRLYVGQETVLVSRGRRQEVWDSLQV